MWRPRRVAIGYGSPTRLKALDTAVDAADSIQAQDSLEMDAMPLDSLFKEHTFESHKTHVLTTAFDQAWAKIVTSRSPLADEGNAPAARLLLARWMIARTQAGESDLNRLVEGAMEYMAKLKLPLPKSS
jgi:hypothetical protein